MSFGDEQDRPKFVNHGLHRPRVGTLDALVAAFVKVEALNTVPTGTSVDGRALIACRPMTIAVCIKVHDGLVLAADSASTLSDGAAGVINVYENANKICNLYKGLPIGFMTWGTGSIGHASMTTIAKDLRALFSGHDPAWSISPKTYTIEEVAKRAKEFIADGLYAQAHGPLPDEKKPVGQMLISGYSAGAALPESWLISLPGRDAEPTIVQAQEATGAGWWGQPEAITRLLKGRSQNLAAALEKLGVPLDEAHEAVSQIDALVEIPFVVSPMPIQDAIDLARFLVYVTVMVSRFSPGPPTVGGPIEIAAITKHEGFKWVQRKHYFATEFNHEVRT